MEPDTRTTSPHALPADVCTQPTKKTPAVVVNQASIETVFSKKLTQVPVWALLTPVRRRCLSSVDASLPDCFPPWMLPGASHFSTPTWLESERWGST